jgi:hypothetical protein
MFQVAIRLLSGGAADAVPPPARRKAPGFVLLGRGRDPADLLSPAHRAAWKQLGGSSAHFGPGGLTDTEGKYAAWFERLNASVVLIRPDFQMFGGVRTPHAADGLVRDLAERTLAQGTHVNAPAASSMCSPTSPPTSTAQRRQ